MQKVLLLFLIIASNLVSAQSQLTIKRKSLPIFEKIVVSDMLKVSVVRGNANGLAITADDDGHKSMAIKVRDGVLYIMQNGRAKLNFTPSLAHIHKTIVEQEIVVTTAQPIEQFTLSGNSFVKYTDTNHLENIGIKADDSSNFEADLNCNLASIKLTKNSGADISGKLNKLKIVADSSVMRIHQAEINTADINISGKTRLYATGKTKILMLNVNQESRFEGIGFESTDAKLTIANRSDAFFKATSTLLLTASDRSHVVCTGMPKTTQNCTPDCKIKIK